MASRRRDWRVDARLLAEHHIAGLRYSRNGREVIAVKHSTFGWISPAQYQAMQEFHELLPKIVEGGYRLKATIAGTEILGLPAGGLLFAYEAAHLAAATAGFDSRTIALWDWQEVLFWAASIVLPFGELLAVIRLLQDLGIAAHVEQATPESGPAVVEGTVTEQSVVQQLPV